MPKEEEKKVEYIDLTPTWEGIVPILLQILEYGDEKGKDFPIGEIKRMAKIADKYSKALKKIINNQPLDKG